MPVQMIERAADGLREKRELLGVSRERLAGVAGVSPATVFRIEKHKVKPRLSTITVLLDALDELSTEVGE